MRLRCCASAPLARPPAPLQAYFSYDAHKSGGVTVSHLRFGPSPISAPFMVEKADYLAVHHSSYLTKYDTLAGLRPGGVLVVNAVCYGDGLAALDAVTPDRVKRQLAELKPSVYMIDARAVAAATGLGKHVNMVMQVRALGGGGGGAVVVGE